MACQDCGLSFYPNSEYPITGLRCIDCSARRGAALSRKRYGALANRAHRAVKAAVKRGDLPHPSELGCTDCHKDAEVYDHRDYRKPLVVEPVCRSCNRKRGPSQILFTKDGRPIDHPARLMAEAVWALAEKRAA